MIIFHQNLTQLKNSMFKRFLELKILGDGAGVNILSTHVNERQFKG